MELIAIAVLTVLLAFYATDAGLMLAGQTGKGGGGHETTADDGDGQIPHVDPAINNNYTLMEHLAQHMKVFEKNYRTTPDNYIAHNYFVEAKQKPNSQEVEVNFTYPLPFGKKMATFTAAFEPVSTSGVLDKFGFASNGTVIKGFLGGDWDYPYILEVTWSSCIRVAEHVREILKSESKYDYHTTVETVRHFMNHIPYAVPKFDSSVSKFHELALAPEVLVLSYGDCDSKSVFMAGVLAELIGKENVVLIGCDCVDPSSPGKPQPHMMVGIAGLNYKRSISVQHSGKTYHLVESTSPHPADTRFDAENIKVYPLT